MNRLTIEAESQRGEQATELLVADCYRGSTDGNEKGHKSRAYRKLHGIILPDQLDSIANVEFLVESVDVIPRGLFWRSSPVGRKLRSAEQRAKGAAYYHQ